MRLKKDIRRTYSFTSLIIYHQKKQFFPNLTEFVLRFLVLIFENKSYTFLIFPRKNLNFDKCPKIVSENF